MSCVCVCGWARGVAGVGKSLTNTSRRVWCGRYGRRPWVLVWGPGSGLWSRQRRCKCRRDLRTEEVTRGKEEDGNGVWKWKRWPGRRRPGAWVVVGIWIFKRCRPRALVPCRRIAFSLKSWSRFRPIICGPDRVEASASSAHPGPVQRLQRATPPLYRGRGDITALERGPGPCT